jgi:hypothetical protein
MPTTKNPPTQMSVDSKAVIQDSLVFQCCPIPNITPVIRPPRTTLFADALLKGVLGIAYQGRPSGNLSDNGTSLTRSYLGI